MRLAFTLLMLPVYASRFLLLCLRPSPALAAENLFLRKQLALYRERDIKPRCAANPIRLALVWLGRWFDWRLALAIVQPETFTRWHRRGFRLFWRWKSRLGRPLIPAELQALIRQMGGVFHVNVNCRRRTVPTGRRGRCGTGQDGRCVCRRGVAQGALPGRRTVRNRLPVMVVSDDTPVIDSAKVRQCLEEEGF
jgi:hypothetical protein